MSTRVRPRTLRRELQRWGVKHAQPIEELSEALEAVTLSGRALTASPDAVERIQRATADAKAFRAAVEAAQALPAAPDPACQAVFARALELWHAGAVLQLTSVHPFCDEGSQRAAEELGRGAEEFARFAGAFLAPVVA